MGREKQPGDCPGNAAWGTSRPNFCWKNLLPLMITFIIKGRCWGCCRSCLLTVVGMLKPNSREGKKRRDKLGKSHFYRVTFLLRPALYASIACEEQYCLKLVWFQPRSMYCTSYMWTTVNSPLSYKIHRWSTNILVTWSFGPPPTELWLACKLVDRSFHFKLPLYGWAATWPKKPVGKGEFPGPILQTITSWVIENWLSFPIVTV